MLVDKNFLHLDRIDVSQAWQIQVATVRFGTWNPKLYPEQPNRMQLYQLADKHYMLMTFLVCFTNCTIQLSIFIQLLHEYQLFDLHVIYY